MTDTGGARPQRPGSRFARAFDDKSPGLDRFGLLLALTVVSVVGLALFDISGIAYDRSQDVGSVVAAALVGATIITALRASGLSRRRQRLIELLVGLTVLGYVVSLFGTRTPEGSASPAVSTLLLVLSLLAPFVVVMRLMRHREVTLATVLGAVSAYLLVAIAFFYLFLTVGRYQGYFFATPQPSSSYMYFSLTTITTVGYGDLTAMTRVGRLLANAEAVIGQVYLVTFVAFIVSLGASTWTKRRKALDEEPADEA